VAGWDQKLFTPELWANLQGLSSKQEDFRLLGPLRSIELVEQRKEGAEQDFRYRLTYDRASLLLLVTRNDDGKFAGIHIRTE
jgi:hypothetical protein